MRGGAADVGAGDPELLAQQVDQQHARLSQGFDVAVIDLQHDARFSHLRPSLAQPTRCLARAMARRNMTPAMWTRKSPGPRPSAGGLVMLCARRTASVIAASPAPLPTRASPASLA